MMMNNTSNISTNESNDSEEINRIKFLTPKNINNFDRNWVYSQQKINFHNPSYFNSNNSNMNNSQPVFEDIRYGKASSFCNPSEYYMNKMYNNNNNSSSSSNMMENMFSLNLEKVASSDKKKPKKKDDNFDENQNVIYLENILSCKDRRTTLMIKNIPNKYNSLSLLEEINVHFKGKYDFFYLPLDFNNNCNLGFAFINFVDPLHILLFYDLFCKKKWKKFKSDKICELAYAKFQGKKELASHFEKSSVMSTSGDNKKPMIFQVDNPLPKVELPLRYNDILKRVLSQ